ncbi:MAG: hypothetical protein BEN18_10205 [Epulopiscium sp. Nuni2H_MBin001]|nr:MAG: hypothetical protein BEN18_10205 [Epulopiscium sp. Nuni2H_MBin001]
MKISKKTLALAIALTIPATTFAHVGRTDANSGHKDNNNVSGLGSYHYHCYGHPAHLHENGICPYDTPEPVVAPVTEFPDLSAHTHLNTDTQAPTYKSTNLNINGITSTVNGVVIDGTTFVELRPLATALGLDIEWDATTKSITCKSADVTIIMTLDSQAARVNNEHKLLDFAPQLIDGKTMLPVRIICETLGQTVNYDSATNTIAII